MHWSDCRWYVETSHDSGKVYDANMTPEDTARMVAGVLVKREMEHYADLIRTWKETHFRENATLTLPDGEILTARWSPR